MPPQVPGSAADAACVSATAADDLATLLATDAVHAIYQPIVDLQSRRTIAFEALARGPVGSTLHSPAALFAAADTSDRLVELDRACRAAAVAGALDAGLSPPTALFVNLEPASAGIRYEPGRHAAVLDRGERELLLVAELTERALTRRPAELLATVERLRGYGWRIALDDVGVDPRSLALLPVLRPDVVKLDLRLVQGPPSTATARVANAVGAYAEDSGSIVVAEGIERESHVMIAQALGATHGQGWHFGRPGALPRGLPAAAAGVLATPALPARTGGSPFELVAAARPERVGVKVQLLATSIALESEAASRGEACVVVSTFQHARHFTPATARRYGRLAESAAFVAAIGEGLALEPAPGVRGTCLAADDALLGEWDIAVLGPHFAAALVAADLGDGGPDAERRFRFVLTFDRDLVSDVVAALMSRVIAEPAPLLAAAAA